MAYGLATADVNNETETDKEVGTVLQTLPEPNYLCMFTFWDNILLTHVPGELTACYHYWIEQCFMEWFLALTHVIASTLQLMCCVRDRKVRAAVPAWLGRELEALFKRIHPREAVQSAWNASYRQHQTAPADGDCFGLRAFSPDEHPVSVMSLEVKLAKQMLPPVLPNSQSSAYPAARAVEQFMRSLSQVRCVPCVFECIWQ